MFAAHLTRGFKTSRSVNDCASDFRRRAVRNSPRGAEEGVRSPSLYSQNPTDGSNERSAQVRQHGTGAADVHADRPLRRERALGGTGRGRRRQQGRADGLEARSGDGETRGGQPESQQLEDGRAGHVEDAELHGGTEGFTQLENREGGKERR